MAPQPNIILVTSHDLGRHLGCYGVKEVRTPNLDRFAGDGVRFENAFCTAPQCSPSRASLFTGRYPHSNGVMGLTHGYFAWDLHPDERHLANYLGEAGWHTAGAGVIHETANPQRIGFDRILADHHDDAAELNKPVFKFLREERPKDRPFYLQVGYFEPHRTKIGFDAPPDYEYGVYVPPYLVAEESALHDLAYFQGAIRKLDTAFGALLNVLDEEGLADNTLVIFTADHGIPYPRAKCSLYDAGLAITLIIRWTHGPWNPGDVITPLVSNLDVTPTLLELLALPVPDMMQGQSFCGLLHGEDNSGRSGIFGEMTYHSYPDPQRCLRTEHHKLIVNFSSSASFMNPSQQWRPSTITVHPTNPIFAHHPPVELYDLHADPLEQCNLAFDPGYATLRTGMLSQLHTWMQETNDPLLNGIPTPPMHHFAMNALRGNHIEKR